MLGHHLEQAYRYRVELGLDGRARGASHSGRPASGRGGRRAARAREDMAAEGLLERAGALLPAGARGRRACCRDRGGARGHRTITRRPGRSTSRRSREALRAGGTVGGGHSRAGRAHVWFVPTPTSSARRSLPSGACARAAPADRRPAGPGRRLAPDRRGRACRGPCGGRAQALEQALDHASPDRSRRALERGLVRDRDVPARRPGSARCRGRVCAGASRRGARGCDRGVEADMLHVLGSQKAAARASTTAAPRSARRVGSVRTLGLRYMGQWSKRTSGSAGAERRRPAAAEEALRVSYDVLVEMGIKARWARRRAAGRCAAPRRAASTRPTRR